MHLLKNKSSEEGIGDECKMKGQDEYTIYFANFYMVGKHGTWI